MPEDCFSQVFTFDYVPQNPADKKFNQAAVDTATALGAMVRRSTAADVRARQDSRLPPLNMYMLQPLVYFFIF